MGKGLLLAIIMAVGLMGLSEPLVAHHGNAAYDSTKSVTMKGVVIDWWWANPHCLLTYSAKSDDGTLVRWIAEASAPVNIIPRGWSKNSMKPGDQITITVEPAKSGKPIGRIESVVLPNGKTLIGLTEEHFVEKDVDEGHTK